MLSLSITHVVFSFTIYCSARLSDIIDTCADFSRMQPVQPNPWQLVTMIFMKMVSAAGAKEAELQGASSVVRGNAVLEAIQGET